VQARRGSYGADPIAFRQGFTYSDEEAARKPGTAAGIRDPTGYRVPVGRRA